MYAEASALPDVVSSVASRENPRSSSGSVRLSCVSHDDEEKKSRFESVLPEILKRAVERGKARAEEAPENLKSFVGDRIPKEVSSYVLHQVDETKNSILKVVAGEVRSFLEATNLSSELRKLLTTVKFEVHTTIRFSPNDDAGKKTERKSEPKGEKQDKHEGDDSPRSDRDEHARERDHDNAPPASESPPDSEQDRDREEDDGLHIELRSGELPKIRRR